MDAITGHELWLVSNGVAYAFFSTLIFITLFFTASLVGNISNVKQNWAQYRCDPSVMPFASMYGHDTAQNFNFCMGEIFSTHSSDMSSSFSSILGTFGSIISTVMNAVGSLRTSVATLGGGINVVVQNISDRISAFFFQLRIAAIHIKYLIGRMYAVMFAVMYMGMSAITGLTSFTRTSLFGFLDTFCFPPDTMLKVENRGIIPIKDVRIGDILISSGSRVCASFQFQATGQPMVRFENGTSDQPFTVSTNHYLKHGNVLIRADRHPDGELDGPWNSSVPLHCLNTHDHMIPVGKYTFCDYDESEEADESTMIDLQNQINGRQDKLQYEFTEYAPSMNRNTQIRMKNGSLCCAHNIKLGDKLSTGATVIGVIEREVYETCMVEGTCMAAATCTWHQNRWRRVGEIFNVDKTEIPQIMFSFVVSPSSMIQLADGRTIRDYLEVCSPDSEKHYSAAITQQIRQTSH